jgi:hypothetical protein
MRMREMERSESFSKLSDVLNKSGKLVEVFSYGKDSPLGLSLSMTGKSDTALHFYEFENGVSIVKDYHRFSGTISRRISGFPDCDYKFDPTSGRWSNYYVLKDGKFIADKEEALSIIKETAGVSIPEKKDEKERSLFSMDIERYPSDEIILGFEIEKTEKETTEYTSRYDSQPSEMKISEQAYELKKAIEKMPKEVGLEKLEEFSKNILSIHAAASKIAKPYEKAKKKDKYFMLME